ncbi:MAG: hypothetical protein V9F02_06080 [Chitinophagaceae bacterium]
MNALIISAVWGVVMMFSGILLKQKSTVRNLAIAGMVLLLVANIFETNGTAFFNVDTHGMMYFRQICTYLQFHCNFAFAVIPITVSKGYGESGYKLCRISGTDIFYFMWHCTYIFL